jgi:two-component sensor histidine kinase
MIWRWLLLSIGWWTIDGITSASQYYSMRAADGLPVSWERALYPTMASALLWVPISVLALWLAHRNPIGPGQRRSAVAVHLGAAAAAIVFRAAAVLALNPWIGWYEVVPPFGTLLATSIQNNIFTYLLVLAAAHALHYARNAHHREVQLAEARLHALKAQLEPHFLFNTLSTITTLVHEDPDAADRMLVRLSELLRQVLEVAPSHEVPLRTELRFIGAYLEIEQGRFESRLQVEWNVDAGVLDAAVPQFVLQPLVENAIRHGLASRPDAGTITISVARVRGALRLAVLDDGVGWNGLQATDGIGLANTRARLAHLYPGRHSFHVGPRDQRGTEATVVIPLRPMRPTSKGLSPVAVPA